MSNASPRAWKRHDPSPGCFCVLDLAPVHGKGAGAARLRPRGPCHGCAPACHRQLADGEESKPGLSCPSSEGRGGESAGASGCGAPVLVPVVTERRERNAQRAENLRGVHAQKKRRAAILFLGCHVPSPLFGDRYLVPLSIFFGRAARGSPSSFAFGTTTPFPPHTSDLFPPRCAWRIIQKDRIKV